MQTSTPQMVNQVQVEVGPLDQRRAPSVTVAFTIGNRRISFSPTPATSWREWLDLDDRGVRPATIVVWNEGFISVGADGMVVFGVYDVNLPGREDEMLVRASHESCAEAFKRLAAGLS